MWCVHEIPILFGIGFGSMGVQPFNRGLVLSQLERGHLQQPLRQVGNAVVFRRLRVIAEQLATHHLSAEMGQLDAQ